MALFVIERNLAEQLQRSRDAARRVTEINRDIGVVMHKPVRRRECLRLAVTAGLVALPAAAGRATSPGSGTDSGTRIVAQHLGAALKQPVTTDNRPGESGAIAASAVGQSAPDGYTLLMGTNSTHGANPGLIAKLPYDPLRDFVPIGLVGIFSSFLVVNPTLPVRTPAELVTYGTANPKTLSFASGNTSSLIMGEMFSRGAGIEICSSFALRAILWLHRNWGPSNTLPSNPAPDWSWCSGTRTAGRFSEPWSDCVGLPHPSRRTRASLPSASNRRSRPAGSGTRLRPGHPDSQKRSSERAPRATGAWAKTPVRPHETAFGKSI